jgi:hypothetical protein
MTWGELRLRLIRQAGELDLDLIDGWLNERYRQILDAHNWRGLRVDATLATISAYRDGTLDATLGATAVTGAGTTWTAGMSGMRIQIAGTPEWYTLTRTGATTGTLERAYEGETVTGAGYVLFQNVYTLPSDLKHIETMLDTQTGLPMQKLSPGELRAAVGRIITLGPPKAWAPATDTGSSDPAMLRRVEIYPIPESAIGVPYTYQRRITAWTSTNLSPLPWVPDQLIELGVKADIREARGDYGGADRAEAKFAAALATLRAQDRRQNPTTALKPAAHWTAHYLRPVRRGGNFRLP